MEAWLTRKHYPVLYVNNDGRDKVIRLTAVGTDGSNISNWIIPITYTTQLYNNFYISNVTWINSSETTTISLHTDYNFAIINTNQNGKFLEYTCTLSYIKRKAIRNWRITFTILVTFFD